MTASRSLLATALPEDQFDAKWYAVHTRHRAEKKVAWALEQKGIEAFVPLLQELHRWTDREQPISLPLFAGYMFVCIPLSRASKQSVLRTGGVLSFVSFGGEAAAVSAKQIQHLRTLLSQKTPCALHSFLRVGQRVRIRGGSLDGIEGILEEKAEKRLVISIEAIHRSVALKIEGYELELL